MGSSCRPMSIILVSMAIMLVYSDTIHSQITQPQNSFSDWDECITAFSGCFNEISQFLFNRGVGIHPGSNSIGPACCRAVLDIHEKCWLLFFPDPFFTPELQNYCRSRINAPAASPLNPPVSPVDPPVSAPQIPSPVSPVDPPASSPKFPSPAPAPLVPSPAPAPKPQSPAPAPLVPSSAPAPKPQSPAPTAPLVPSPAPKLPSPAPAPALV